MPPDDLPARQAACPNALILSQDAALVRQCLAALAAAGVRIYRVSPEEPSLEDVYFALQGEEVAA